MILDSLQQLASAYAPTAVATNVNGTYFNASAAPNWGMGASLIWYTRVSTTVTGNANATLLFKLQAATDAAFTSPIDVSQAPAITAITQANFATQAVAGTEFKIKIPRENAAYQYWRLAVVIGTATLTAGAFDSWLHDVGVQDNKSYPAGYSVL